MLSLRAFRPVRRLRRTALLAAVVMAVSSLPPAAQPVSANDRERAELEARVAVARERPEERLGVVAELDARIDVTGFDPVALARSLDHDPRRLHAFVRDEVAYEPYRGFLRGGAGTLMARAGNAADKALLLATLLEASGYRARIARGTLPAEAAEALVTRARRPPGRTAPPAPRDGPGSLPAYGRELRAANPALAAGLERQEREAAAARERLWSEVAREAAWLEKTLEAAGVRLGGPAALVPPDRLAAEAADHFWVRAEIDGATVDLDPTAAGAGFGARPAAAASGEWAVADLPDDLVHVAGESPEAALRRELREETGLSDFDLGPCVWVRRHVWRWQGRWYDQRERYYLARARSTAVDASGLGRDEMQAIRDFRWWTAEEIAAAGPGDTFVPRALARLLPPLLDGKVPGEPVDVGI